MAHARLIALALAASLAACTPEPTPLSARAPAPAVSGAPIADASPGWDQGKWGTFRSKRFGVALLLPDGASWRIDDHHAQWLVADHPPTGSHLRLRVFYEEHAMSRDKCEASARAQDPGLPASEGARIVDQRDHDVLPGWDGKLTAFVRDPQRGAAVEGHVQAFASNVRKCIAIDFVTSATGAEVVGARLSDIADRLVHGLSFADVLGAPPREPLPTAPTP